MTQRAYEMKPQRIQRKRGKGWKMPENAVSVCRPGEFGNPFTVTQKRAPGKSVNGEYICVPTLADAIDCFRMYAHEKVGFLDRVRTKLRGKHLACWCKIGAPCHADVLLELANEELL